MNYLKIYINSIPLKVPMSFGINKNVIFNGLDISDRINRKGEVSKKFCFIEMIKLDESDKPIGREEFGFFKLDSKNLSFAQSNFYSLFNKLFILSAAIYGDDEEALDAKMAEVSKEIYGKDGYDIADEANELFQYNSSTRDKKKKKPSQKEIEKMVDSLNVNVGKLFYGVLKDKAGIDNSPRLEILSVMDKKGYKGLPQEDDWVSNVEGTLSLDIKYNRFKEAAEKPDTPDEAGDEYSEEALDDIIDDDGEAGDLEEIDDLEEVEEID